jgi:cold shock CspA family protein
MPETRTAVVEQFDVTRGIGRLVDADGIRYFVHFENVHPRALPLLVGERVTFTPAPGSPHPRALNVRPVAAPEPVRL